MFKEINFDDIDKGVIEDYILIDVRTPMEYNDETIPGAINIPIFNDEERELIGTVYVQESIEKAKQIGVNAVSKRLPSIYEKISHLDKEYKYLVFFCSRGGYRSSSLVSLFRSIGTDAIKLEGGYKGYRKYINDNLPELIKQIEFVVLYGNTGTGKTEILKILKEKGMDVLDLEGCANHRGSTLGGVGMGVQNTQKEFESLIYQSLKNRKTNLVFVEGESKRIGKVVIPNYIYDSIKKGINLKIEANINTRINNILEDYVHDTDQELITALNFLRKYLGDKTIDKYNEMIKKHEYRQVIEELILKYYDPLYKHKSQDCNIVFDNNNPIETANNIIQWVGKNK